MLKFKSVEKLISQLKPEKPIYCIRKNSVTTSSKYFQKNFPGEILYAVKTNPHPLVIKALIDSGINQFDVASIDEIKQVKKFTSKAKCSYMHTVKSPESIKEARATFIDAWIDFFRKPQIWGMLAFVFLFRSGEGLLLGVGHLFLQADSEVGGIGLSLAQKSIIDGTVSTVVSLAGGILGGMFISKYGLKKTLFTMAICLNLPNLTYVYLAFAAQGGEPVTLWTVGSLVTIEKFFYSFGFIANMLYMMQQISPGKYHMTHYAFCTAIMNLVLWPTTAVSGFLADYLGYLTFFIIVMFATIPSFLAAWYAPFPRSGDELNFLTKN